MAISHTLETVQLANGARGLLVDTPGAPVAAYSIQFRSGSDELTRAYPFQVAHTLEHMVEAGPNDPKYPKKSDFVQEIQKNGAWRNAFTGEFGVSHVGDCTSDELLRILKLRLSAAENPKLNEKILKSESGNVLEEMRQRVSDYTRLANALSRKTLSDGAWQTSKEAMAEAASVTLEQVEAYYKNAYTINNLSFIVVADMKDVKDSVLELFGSSSLPAGQRLSGPATVPITNDMYCYEQRPALENLFTSFAMAIPRQLTAKEVAAMQIINNIFCNTWDSRILGKARDAGLCYSMRGYTEALKTQTIWAFDTPISYPNATEFFTLMSEALKDVSTNGANDLEIQKAKALLVGQSKKNGQTTQDLLYMYADDYFGLDILTTAQEKIDLLNSITSEDVSALVREFASTESRVFSGVGSVEEEEFSELYGSLVSNL